GDAVENTTNSRFGFEGDVRDPQTGLLTDGGGRTYDPTTSRYLGGNVGPNGNNTYEEGGNAPINAADSSGDSILCRVCNFQPPTLTHSPGGSIQYFPLGATLVPAFPSPSETDELTIDQVLKVAKQRN